MKKIVIVTLLLFVTITHSFTILSKADSEATAAKFLNVDSIFLDNESKDSYFFVTEFEYEEDDLAEDYPCFRGVVINKTSNKVVDPYSDKNIQISFPYSDSLIEGLVVVNCAD